jgi:hypothetical protein
MIWLDGYEKIVVSTNRTGEHPRRPNSPPRIVLHTTEGLRIFDYPFPPANTLGLVGDPHSLPAGKYWTPGKGMTEYKAGQEIRHQHCDLDLTSYALLHRSSDPETNHEGAHCVQVEIISAAASTPKWSDGMYGLVASWLADVVTALPELLPALDNYPEPDKWSAHGSYGFTTPYRMGWEEWQFGINDQAFLCGHQHVPGNEHWDPGNLNIVKLTGMAKQILGAPPVIVEPDIPTWRILRRLTAAEQRLHAHNEAIVTLRQRMARYETK